MTSEQQEHLTKDLNASVATQLPETDFYLEFSPQTSRLSLKRNHSNEHGIFVDFESDEHKYKQQRISSGKDLLARAIGVEPGISICDLTLGLAGDAFKLCYFGAQVVGYEKNEFVWALVKNATWRWNQKNKPLLLNSINADSMTADFTSAEVFYLDPMFNLVRTALPRKGMQYLDLITAPTPEKDLDVILVGAKEAKKKLVVKRALQSDWLCGYKPSRSVEGKMVRFDIYGH
jgi:16S rRNA (guanine1516-N2)-methyltransferase